MLSSAQAGKAVTKPRPTQRVRSKGTADATVPEEPVTPKSQVLNTLTPLSSTKTPEVGPPEAPRKRAAAATAGVSIASRSGRSETPGVGPKRVASAAVIRENTDLKAKECAPHKTIGWFGQDARAWVKGNISPVKPKPWVERRMEEEEGLRNTFG